MGCLSKGLDVVRSKFGCVNTALSLGPSARSQKRDFSNDTHSLFTCGGLRKLDYSQLHLIDGAPGFIRLAYMRNEADSADRALFTAQEQLAALR